MTTPEENIDLHEPSTETHHNTETPNEPTPPVDVADEEEDDTDDDSNRQAAQIEELKDKYLRLAAEFDNYKRRASRERVELIGTAGREMLVALLPVLDDFERAIKANETATDVATVAEGVRLVQQRFTSILKTKGLTEMDSNGIAFDADKHEAIAEIPAGDAMQGKVVDTVEKGYTLSDKIIRYAKVVVGK